MFKTYIKIENKQKEVSEMEQEIKQRPMTITELVEEKVNESRNLDGEALYKCIMDIKQGEAFHLTVQKIGRKNIANRLYVTELKKAFYQREELERERYVHDNSPAKMKDVDRAVTTAYTMLLKMVSMINNDNVDSVVVFKEVRQAINNIEKHLGINETTWTLTDRELEAQKIQAESNGDNITTEVDKDAN